ncbi:MAG: hypothetical protein NC131_09980 [Roseburia sp.]|nr:hypothetical protein [Roseburia sp.]
MSKFDLDSIDLITMENIHGARFLEFCESIDGIINMTDDEFYLEAVKDPGTRWKQTKSVIANNTSKTSGGMLSAYNNITDAGGNIIGAVFDVIMGSINLSTKIIKFLTDRIVAVPRMIGNVSGKVAQIPGDTRAKIRGDIRINITVTDIEKLYNETLMQRLTTFIGTAAELSKGDVWTVAFNITHAKTQGLVHLKDNDIRRCKQMTSLYNQLKGVKFTPTTINMTQDANYDIYFGGQRSIKFTDLSGKQHHCSYYEALNQLMSDINAKKKDLEDVQKSLGAKYDRTQMNQAFTHIGPSSRTAIVDTLQMVSRMIALVGDIVKCIILDINEVNKACDAVLHKRGIN